MDTSTFYIKDFCTWVVIAHGTVLLFVTTIWVVRKMLFSDHAQQTTQPPRDYVMPSRPWPKVETTAALAPPPATRPPQPPPPRPRRPKAASPVAGPAIPVPAAPPTPRPPDMCAQCSWMAHDPVVANLISEGKMDVHFKCEQCGMAWNEVVLIPPITAPPSQ